MTFKHRYQPTKTDAINIITLLLPVLELVHGLCTRYTILLVQVVNFFRERNKKVGDLLVCSYGVDNQLEISHFELNIQESNVKKQNQKAIMALTCMLLVFLRNAQGIVTLEPVNN